MSSFEQVTDKQGTITAIATAIHSETLLNSPKLNKASAFSQEERIDFDLIGRLPYGIETLEQQVDRLYQQFLAKGDNLQKNIYLQGLYHTNETAFYKLLSTHLGEILPIIYTPTISKVVQQFSHDFRRPRGLYIAYPDRHYIDQILTNLDCSVDIIVITDGEGVLGIGDQGIGGIEICIAKSIVYVLCGGLNPHRILSIQIDVGTNNKTLLADPAYLGWRHERISGLEYDDFIAQIIAAIKHKFPHVYLHWEDFGVHNARRNLQHYRETLCSFNDDMQGTGAVTLAAILTAVRRCHSTLSEQRVVIFGPGTAGTGIADQLCAGMLCEGLSSAEAQARFWLVGRHGLLTTAHAELLAFQAPYARPATEVSIYGGTNHSISLEAVITQVQPTLLIGCSGQGGAFTETIITKMASKVTHPIILPLSNPTEQAEAKPADLLRWTQGKALIATGSPFAAVDYNGSQHQITQCNNALIFPGIGLGVVIAKSKYLSDTMIWQACLALSESTPADIINAPLLPPLNQIQPISKRIALAVAEQARREGLAQVQPDTDFNLLIEQDFWSAHYHPYRRQR